MWNEFLHAQDPFVSCVRHLSRFKLRSLGGNLYEDGNPGFLTTPVFTLIKGALLSWYDPISVHEEQVDGRGRHCH